MIFFPLLFFFFWSRHCWGNPGDLVSKFYLPFKQVLSNEVTRTKYDRALKFRTDSDRSRRGNRRYSSEFEDGVRISTWAELRRKLQYERHWKNYNSKEEYSSFYRKAPVREVQEENPGDKRGSFTAVLRSAFISLFLLKVFGYQLSLTFSSLTALFDGKLDGGYKIGYLIAWILGGRGGILLTLCLSFASWVCGKTSSGVVVLVVVAVWIGSNLARCAPLPQGALIALLYMSLKLQTDSSWSCWFYRLGLHICPNFFCTYFCCVVCSTYFAN